MSVTNLKSHHFSFGPSFNDRVDKTYCSQLFFINIDQIKYIICLKN